MARVILLTGGNLGDVRATLAGARLKLAERVGAETAASSLWSPRLGDSRRRNSFSIRF